MKKLLVLCFAALIAVAPAVAQVGLTGIPATAPVSSLGNAFAVRCGSLVGANFNSTADQPITITSPTTNYYIFRILATNASASLSSAVGGIYSAASKGGTQVLVSSTPWSGLTGAAVNAAGSALFTAPTINTVASNWTTLYLSLTTPQGSAATADIDFWCIPVR